jgi:hypothetical protein
MTPWVPVNGPDALAAFQVGGRFAHVNRELNDYLAKYRID